MSELRTRIAELLDRGLSEAEIAWQLGVASTTVRYHALQLRSQPDFASAAPEPEPPDTSALRRPTRELVLELMTAGLTRAETARRLGLQKSTVSYHARMLGEEVDGRCARRYDWTAVQRYHDAGHSKLECQTKFGFCSQSWYAATIRGDLVPRPHAMPLEQLLAPGRRRNRDHIKRRLLALGVKEARCEACGISEWRGRALSMSLHHINGDRHDNRLENLRLLCPNCHSQTPNFAGRNGRPGPRSNLRPVPLQLPEPAGQQRPN